MEVGCALPVHVQCWCRRKATHDYMMQGRQRSKLAMTVLLRSIDELTRVSAMLLRSALASSKRENRPVMGSSPRAVASCIVQKAPNLPLRNRATSVPAEVPAYWLDLVRPCDLFPPSSAGAEVAQDLKSHIIRKRVHFILQCKSIIILRRCVHGSRVFGAARLASPCVAEEPSWAS